MIRWLKSLWHEHCRQRDLQLLWPVCKANAKNLASAKAAFALHAANDPAWAELGPIQIARIIDALE